MELDFLNVNHLLLVTFPFLKYYRINSIIVSLSLRTYVCEFRISEIYSFLPVYCEYVHVIFTYLAKTKYLHIGPSDQNYKKTSYIILYLFLI